MPVLAKPKPHEEVSLQSAVRGNSALFPVCANPKCGSSWLRLWRNRQAPVIEGGWTCSAECTRAAVEGCLRRETEGAADLPQGHRHRVPIGLILLEKGWISREQLRAALDAHREAIAKGKQAVRVGTWLVEQTGLEERLLTRALGIQWNCPVFEIANYRPETVCGLVPRLFLDAFGVLPLHVAAASVLYVAFADRIDRCVTFALERMTGLRVEAGLADGSEFRAAHAVMLGERFPAARLIEAASSSVLTQELTRVIEATKPQEGKLVRLREYFWLRLWHRKGAPAQEDETEDVVCSITRFG
ncbi:hypothetical protein [Paracidobacterium acidisoli]|uniref:Type II secretion system protein GspE N-terminal domain-containing protein n=1 Tax=Paracidobacterium acidisoli TaxID=2303751 RepID=A0A372IR91_9BACT|nr:hypothetical protein [Paracidobacterium acidisoli]MBT9330307.1 hypothetical protein [Paracidobacterium acidisoli]